MTQALENMYLDQAKLGAMLRLARVKAGYNTAESFTHAIREYTGYDVSVATMYGVERGIREPKLGLYVAIHQTLGLEITDKLLRDCAPDISEKQNSQEK